MRVTCENVDDFIECVSAELVAAGKIFQGVIRVNISQRPVDGNTRDSTKFDIVLQASAVMICADESQYLLECGVDCGRDYHDETQEKSGSELAKVRKEKIERFAKDMKAKVLPGVIGI